MPIFTILWARRLIVAAAFFGTLIGGIVVLLVSPPYYLATARVIMEYVKPDPVTGEYMSSKSVDAYVASQIAIVRDYQTARPAAEILGWLDSPELQIQYASRPATETREFGDWVGARLIPGISARPVEDSNILEIGFRGSTPRDAVQIVEAIRTAYINQSIKTRAEQAEATAQKMTTDTQRTRDTIARLEAEKKAYQALTGITLARAHLDLDNVLLRRYVGEKPRVFIPPEQQATTASTRLAAAEQQLAQARATLGPNHPALIRLQQQRDMYEQEVKTERARVASIGDSILALGRTKAALLEAQKTKVLAGRQQMLQLSLMQDEIDRQHRMLETSLGTIANLRQLTSLNEGRLTPIGVAKPLTNPIFPSPPLILGGCAGLGLIFGILLALLTECLDRRVRTPSDLAFLAGAPVLGDVPRLRVGVSKPRRTVLRRLRGGSVPIARPVPG